MKNFKLQTGDGNDLSRKQIIGVIVVIVFVAYFSIKFTNSPYHNSNEVKEIATSVAPTPKPIDPAVLETYKKQLADLKTKFDYKYDEFEKKGWYTAKSQSAESTSYKTLLRAFVNNSGYIYLASQYHGDDWIFHTKATVKIGDTVYTTEDIPSYDSNNERTNSTGGVWEEISFIGGKDNGILKAIAESGDLPIKVRLSGDQDLKDFTLSQKDQQAIKDAYQLSDLIKKVGDTGIPQS